jgi:hypothetical protein
LFKRASGCLIARADETVAAGVVAALFVLGQTRDPIAAQLVVRVYAETFAACTCCLPLASWEVDKGGAKFSLTQRGGSLIAARAICQRGFLCTVKQRRAGALRVGGAWAGLVKGLNSINGTTLLRASVVDGAGVAASPLCSVKAESLVGCTGKGGELFFDTAVRGVSIAVGALSTTGFDSGS